MQQPWPSLTTVATGVLQPQQPQIILLKEGTDTSQGKPQLISNINACMAVVDTVRTTLGPRGMDKLIYNERVHWVQTMVNIRAWVGHIINISLTFMVSPPGEHHQQRRRNHHENA